LTEIKTDEVFLHSIDAEEWALSAPEAVQLQPTCINLNDTITPTVPKPSIRIQGDVILHIPRQCTVTVGHHVIPTRLLMAQDLGKIRNRMAIPAMQTHQLLNMHGAQLLEEKLDDELNDVFKDMLETHHKKTLAMNATSKEIKKLLKEMMTVTHDAEKMQLPFHYHAITWTTLAFVTVAIAAIVYWVWRVWKRPPQRTVTEEVFVEIPLNTKTDKEKRKKAKKPTEETAM
jgi:hypothetical protein